MYVPKSTIITKYVLDSKDIREYKEIVELAKTFHEEIWGLTINPELLAKKLAGEKINPSEVFRLQKEIVLEIVKIIHGAIFIEVYTDAKTQATSMVEQGRIIASMHPQVIVSLPTTREGFKARTFLRQENIPVNNTLVFSQEQIFATCVHESLIQQKNITTPNSYPSCISPFVGEIDEIGEDGIDLVAFAMRIKQQYNQPLWIQESSVKNFSHMAKGEELKVELISAPATIYRKWLSSNYERKENAASEATNLTPMTPWEPSSEILNIKTLEDFELALTRNSLDIRHDLTDKGLAKLIQNWQKILH